jgi:hypothetical protein
MTREYVVAENKDGLLFLSEIGTRILRGAKELKGQNDD